jgi:hypothetical protein
VPAKNAPRANETPNSMVAPYAMLTAAATTHSVNSSRDPTFCTCHRIHGKRRRPTTSISATKPPTCSSVIPSERHSDAAPSPAPPFSQPASGGSRTSTSTIARSSTTSQPTATRPLKLSRTPRLSSARSKTTVLATDSDRPNTRAAPMFQPQNDASAMPIAVAATICTTAPGTAMRRTASRSAKEKCRPTPNISSITPISASSLARLVSATKPGVNGPISTPASR